MADNDKEKEDTQQDEQDTGKLSVPGTKSPKPGSAKPSSARSSKSRTVSGQGSAKQRTGSGKASPVKSSSKVRKESKVEVKSPGGLSDDEDNEPKPPPPLPEGAKAIFLSTKTQELFECTADVNVTEENPKKLIPKEAILSDMIQRAAVSDFSPFKKTIQEYPGDEIVVVYDAEFAYGQNFYIALTEKAKELILNPPKRKKSAGGRVTEGVGDEDEEEAEAEEEEEDVVHVYVPPVAKDWVSQGSEKEIDAENVIQSRSKIKMSVKRLRRDFGAPVQFSDRSVTDAKDGYVECVSFEDKTFDLRKIEIDTGVQAVPDLSEAGTQTEWKHPRNANTQYYPREFEEQQKEEIQKETQFKTFVTNVTPRFELALQQNEIMDVFYDDWMNLAGQDGSFGGKADSHLKEYQSFTDLQFSKDKTITCIDWHPTVKGIVAVSVAEKLSFDSRVDQSAKIVMKPSLLLIWSFTDPIHPQLLLEAPDDIYCFKFSPTDPNIVAGGCLNGQLVLWDISQYEERLKNPKAGAKKKNPGQAVFEDEAPETPIMRYCAVSGIENSHKSAITDLLWIPDHMELNRMGIPQENRTLQSVQIMTCATDNCILVWDTRPPKGTQHEEKGTMKNPMGVPTTFKYLDLNWKPHLKVQLHKSEPGGDHSPTKFSIQEKQGDRNVLSTLGDASTHKDPAASSGGGGGGFNFAKPGSGREKRTLSNVKTVMFAGGEDGEILYVDWMPQKDQDSNKLMTPKPEFYSTLHDGPVNTAQRSPFFKDIILFVGGWTFSIWKEGVNTGPILMSSASPKRLTCGQWSPSRPGVFYISLEDGSIDVWDVLDRTHEPSINQSVSSASITCIFPYQVTGKQHLLAVGDSTGTLHILEIPWSLRTPTNSELTGVTSYFDREVKRRSFVKARWDFREQEKRQLEADAKMKAGIAPNVTLSEEEVLMKMKQEYLQYVEEESAFLRHLGLKDDIDEPLPEV